MTNKLKLVIMTVLMAVLALTLSLFTINLKSADAADSNYSGSGTFEMVNTVKLRLDDDGFAFKAKMDADTYESVAENENKKIMFIIVPYTFKATIGSGAWVDGGTTHYWGLIRRYASDGEGYSKGDFNASASYCVYVEATAYYDSIQEVYFLQAGIGNILEKNRTLDYFAVAVIEERVYDGETLTGFNYTYANVPSGKTAMPETNICDVVTSAFYGDTKYINVINDVYSWFGTEDYPVPVNDDDDYACLQDLYDSEEYGDYVKGLYYNIYSEIETDDENYPLDNATTTYQVTFNVNNEDYGTTTETSFRVAEGTAITINGTRITIGNTVITALPSDDTEQYHYYFEDFTVGEDDLPETVTENITITANFDSSLQEYTVSLVVGQEGYGSLTATSVANVPYGTEITASDNTVTINGTTVTATPTAQTAQYSYAFDSWENGTATVTGNTTVTANFNRSVREYTVSLVVGQEGYGTVSTSSVANVPYGTVITASENTVTINGTTVTATPTTETAQYSYAFDSWANGDVMVEENITVTANFNRSVREYTVSLVVGQEGYGSLTATSVANVPYGTVITASDNTVTINGTTVTAAPAAQTAQYSYAFNNWTNGTATVNGATTVTANFTRTTNTYTVTINSNNAGYGTVTASSVADVPYGTKITTSGNTVTINGTTVTANPASQTAQYNYAFSSWTNGTATVNGATTVTANFNRSTRTYTVSGTVDGTTANLAWDAINIAASKGTVTTTQNAAQIANYTVTGVPYGTNLKLTITHSNANYEQPIPDTFTVNGNVSNKNYTIDEPALTVYNSSFTHAGYKKYTSALNLGDRYYLSNYEQVDGKYYYLEYNVTINRGSNTSHWAYNDFGVGFLIGAGTSSTGIMMAYQSGWKFEVRTSAGSEAAWDDMITATATDVSTAMNNALAGTAVKLTCVRAGDFIALFVNDTYVGSCFTYQVPTLATNGNGHIGLYARCGVGCTFTNVNYNTTESDVKNKVKSYYNSYATGTATKQANNLTGWGTGFTVSNGSSSTSASGGSISGATSIAMTSGVGTNDISTVQYSGEKTNYFIEADVSDIVAKNSWNGCQVGFNIYGGDKTIDVFVEHISDAEGYAIRVFATDWSINKLYNITSGTAYNTLVNAFSSGSMHMALRRSGTKYYVYVDGVLIKSFSLTEGVAGIAAAGFAHRGTACTITNMKLYTL